MLTNRILVEAGDKYILFTTRYVNRTYEGRTVECVKLKAVKNSGLGGFLRTGSQARRTITTYVERDSTRHGPRIYECQIEKTSSYLQDDERIYVYSFNPIVVLPSIVYHVKHGRYLDKNWHLDLAIPEVPVVPLALEDLEDLEIPLALEVPVPEVQELGISGIPSIPSIPSIPIHVLKWYIDGLIQKNETCPITLEEFRLGHITVTGCGHAFQKGSLDTVAVCPMCRVTLRKEDFVSL
jgi:hypothetical protein